MAHIEIRPDPDHDDQWVAELHPGHGRPVARSVAVRYREDVVQLTGRWRLQPRDVEGDITTSDLPRRPNG